jgi:hypothetical protein
MDVSSSELGTEPNRQFDVAWSWEANDCAQVPPPRRPVIVTHDEHNFIDVVGV